MRVFEARRVYVEGEHLRASGPEEPAEDLSHETAADYGHAVTDVHRCESHAVQSDGRDGRERSSLEGYSVGNLGAKVRWDTHELCVVCILHPGAGNGVPRIKADDGRPDLEDASCGAVTDRSLLGELALDGLPRTCDTFGQGTPDHRLDEIRALTSPIQERLARRQDSRTLRPGADDREGVPHEEAPGRNGGDGNVAHDGQAATRLKDLLHEDSDLRTPTRFDASEGLPA
jgi:hypothetical protein